MLVAACITVAGVALTQGMKEDGKKLPVVKIDSKKKDNKFLDIKIIFKNGGSMSFGMSAEVAGCITEKDLYNPKKMRQLMGMMMLDLYWKFRDKSEKIYAPKALSAEAFSETISKKINTPDIFYNNDSCKIYNDGNNGNPFINRNFPFSYIESVDFSDVKKEDVTDEIVGLLAKHCCFLKKVNLLNCLKLRDSAIIKLAENCAELRELNLLRDFYISYTDAALIALAKNCKQLTSLNLCGCFKVTDVGLKAIGENCKQLTNLNLNCCYKVTDLGLKAICENCKNLTSLDLTYCKQVTDVGIKAVGEGCKKLKEIRLWGTSVSEEGRKKLENAIPGLEIKN